MGTAEYVKLIPFTGRHAAIGAFCDILRKKLDVTGAKQQNRACPEKGREA
jgi:hypothetical protein